MCSKLILNSYKIVRKNITNIIHDGNKLNLIDLYDILDKDLRIMFIMKTKSLFFYQP